MTDDDRRPRWLTVPTARNAVLDLLHFARQVPTQPLARVCHLGPVAEARQQTAPRVGWAALFLNAYGLAARRIPELRQAYMTWPWPHLYEHPCSVASLTVSRAHAGQDALFFPHILGPENKPLTQIHDEVQHYSTAPVWDVAAYRRQLRYCGLPQVLRRAAWWLTMHRSGPKRARHFGTFGVTSVGAEGADTPDAYSVLTGTLTYGPIDPSGRCIVTLVYDHRVMDGRTAGRALAEVERTLNTTVRDELLRPRAAAA